MLAYYEYNFGDRPFGPLSCPVGPRSSHVRK